MLNIVRVVDSYLFDSRYAAPGGIEYLRRFLRFPFAIVRDAFEGQLTMRAMSLVYTTMLSIVPLIALSFSILKGFDVHYQVEPLISRFLAPLGTSAADKITNYIMSFVNNVKGVALGSAGLVILIYTVISMAQKVEESLNYVWQVQAIRSIGRRFSQYLSIIIIAPVAMLIAISLIGAVSSHNLTQKLLNAQWISDTVFQLGRLAPFALVAAVFSFIYGIIPNTRVNPFAAITGGVTAGVMWAGTGKLFAAFVASSTRYTAIYSTFAIVIVALVWLYISWLILLIGGKISFYSQHPEYLRHGHRQLKLGNAMRERLALSIMALVGRDYRDRNHCWTISSLAGHIGVPSRGIGPITESLERAGLLLLTEDEHLVPGRAMDLIPVKEILSAVRDQPTSRHHILLPNDNAVEELLKRLGVAMDDSLAGITLQTIVQNEIPTSPVGPTVTPATVRPKN